MGPIKKSTMICTAIILASASLTCHASFWNSAMLIQYDTEQPATVVDVASPVDITILEYNSKLRELKYSESDSVGEKSITVPLVSVEEDGALSFYDGIALKFIIMFAIPS